MASLRIDQPPVVFLIGTWVVSMATLGIAGPSLTRLIILLPVYLVMAALGFGSVVQRRPQLAPLVLLLIVWVGLWDGYRYLSGGAAAPEYYAASATPTGKEAAKLAKQGRKVVCVVSRDANVVSFLVHGEATRVKVVEFYRRPLDPSRIPPKEFRPDILLIENNDAFSAYADNFPAKQRLSRNEVFSTVRFPAL